MSSTCITDHLLIRFILYDITCNFLILRCTCKHHTSVFRLKWIFLYMCNQLLSYCYLISIVSSYTVFSGFICYFYNTVVSVVSSYSMFSGFSGSDGRGILPCERLQQGAHVSQDKQPLQMNYINFTGKTPPLHSCTTSDS